MAYLRTPVYIIRATGHVFQDNKTKFCCYRKFNGKPCEENKNYTTTSRQEMINHIQQHHHCEETQKAIQRLANEQYEYGDSAESPCYVCHANLKTHSHKIDCHRNNCQ